MLVILRNASPTWSGDKTDQPKIDFSHEPSSGSLSSEVLCRPTFYSRVPTSETGFTQTKVRAYQRSIIQHTFYSTMCPLSQCWGLNCPTLSLCIAGHILVQKLDFWDGNVKKNFQNICFHSTHVHVRLFKNNKQAYNVIAAKRNSLFFSATIFQLTNVNMVSASTCQGSSFRSAVSRNRNSSDGTVTELCARRLRYRSSIPRRLRSCPFNSNKSPTRCNSFPVYYPDVCLQLNIFRAFSRPSSGAQ